jgi:hypothetical protein
VEGRAGRRQGVTAYLEEGRMSDAGGIAVNLRGRHGDEGCVESSFWIQAMDGAEDRSILYDGRRAVDESEEWKREREKVGRLGWMSTGYR